MNLMELFPFLVLFQVLCTLGINFTSLYFCFQLLKTSNIRSKTSPTLMLFICYLVILSISMGIYCIYLLVFWRPEEILYYQTTIYLFGFLSWILLISNPIFEFCLCLERCLAVCFPFQYNIKWKRKICIFTIALVAAYIALNFWVNDLTHLPQTAEQTCRFFTCIIYALKNRFVVEFKIFVSVMDILAAATLIILMKFKLSTGSSMGKNKNRVILIIIFITTIFEFTPNLIDFIISKFSTYGLIDFIGPYRTTISSLNLLIIIILYSRVLKKPGSKVNTINPNTVTASTRVFTIVTS